MAGNTSKQEKNKKSEGAISEKVWKKMGGGGISVFCFYTYWGFQCLLYKQFSHLQTVRCSLANIKATMCGSWHFPTPLACLYFINIKSSIILLHSLLLKEESWLSSPKLQIVICDKWEYVETKAVLLNRNFANLAFLYSLTITWLACRFQNWQIKWLKTTSTSWKSYGFVVVVLSFMFNIQNRSILE